MKSDCTNVNTGNLLQLLAAAEAIALPEIEKATDAVINELKLQPPFGVYDSVAARHMWDEYCWAQQNGRNHLSSESWIESIRPFISGVLDGLPQHTLVFLSVFAAEHNSVFDEYEISGICPGGIETVILERLVEKASCPNLDMIGPHRADVIGTAISGEGLVCSTLAEANLLHDILLSHLDALIDPAESLAEIAEELVDSYVELITNEPNRMDCIEDLFRHYETNIKNLLKDEDVVPALKGIRQSILKDLNRE